MTTPQTEQRELTAGRELDTLIAEKVFRATSIKEGHVIDVASWTEGSDLFAEYGSEHRIVPRYSTELAAAWEVVQYINAYRGCVDWSEWTASWGNINRIEMMDRAELAEWICLAALKAVQS